MTHPTPRKPVAIYARVSTSDQKCERQIKDLREFAAARGYLIDESLIFQETAGGSKNDRQVRAAVMELARAGKIEAILCTELTRWGRSMTDLMDTLQQLNAWGVSVIAQRGFEFDLKTPHGKMLAGVLASLAEFEKDLLKERVKSGLANAKAQGKRLGRQHGQNPSDKYASKVVVMLNNRQSIRSIANELQISTTTVQAIAKRNNLQSIKRATING